MLRNPKGVEKNRARTASSHAKPVESRGFLHPVQRIEAIALIHIRCIRRCGTSHNPPRTRVGQRRIPGQLPKKFI